MVQDYDLRDLGNKIYNNEIKDDTAQRNLNSKNTEFIKLDKSNSENRKECNLDNEVIFTCEDGQLSKYKIIKSGLVVDFKPVVKGSFIHCYKMICDSKNRLIFLQGENFTNIAT
jgi:hypothetical protein